MWTKSDFINLIGRDENTKTAKVQANSSKIQDEPGGQIRENNKTKSRTEKKQEQ